MKKIISLFIWPLLLAPLVYLWLKWKELPAEIPMHYGADGQADRMGPKGELVWLVVILTIMAILLYLLLPLVYKIDPRKTAADNKARLKGIALVTALFLSLVNFLIVDNAGRLSFHLQQKWLFAGIGLLWAVLGNYMYNMKPNYFAGLRLPWTLNNEDNWRRTHHLAGKLWFATGLLIIVLAFVLPANFILYFFIGLVLVSVLVPAIYSYRLFASQRQP
jgi:uncharacterized membrane protein